MPGFTAHIKKHSRPYIESLRDDIANRRNPDYFWPSGTQIFVGAQGSGKTISAVHAYHEIKATYPKAIMVSNVDLKYYKRMSFVGKDGLTRLLETINPAKEYISFDDSDQLALVLTGVNNGIHGVMYFLDEIHTYFNSLQSKEVPIWVFTEISQQRKQRKCIIGTSQVFMRMSKALREQADSMIVCNTIFGILTTQTVFDGMSLSQDSSGAISGHVKKKGWFFHTRIIRNAFDTYQKVVSSNLQLEEIQQAQELKYKGKKLSLG